MLVNQREVYLRDKTQGVDPLVDKLLSEEDCPERITYSKAVQIHNSSLRKQYVEASLLCSTDIEAISSVIEIPSDILQIYSAIFYDVLELDKLSKMELLDVSDKSEASLKLWALSQGLDFIAWRLGKQVQISPVDGLTDLFTTCVYKSREAMFSANAAESSKEATKWVKLSMDIARLLKTWVTDNSAAKNELEVAIREIIPEFQGFNDLEGFSIEDLTALNKE